MMIPRGITTALAVALFLAATSTSTQAQIVASEVSSVSQTVDGTVLDLHYSRPSLRVRQHIFGSEVPLDTLWTPGADWATTLVTNKEIEIEGTKIPPGKYTMWMIVRRGDWDVVFDPRDKVFHVPHPARSDSQIVFTVTPDTTAPVMETLQFSFPEVRSDGADLRFHWERTVVDMTVKVTPSQILTVTPEQAAPYLGTYAAEVVSQGPDAGEPHRFELEMKLDGEYMGGRIEWDSDFSDIMYFAVKADQIFTPVTTINGSIAGVINQLFMEFTLGEDGLARSFEMRMGDEDQLLMKGERVERD